MQPAHKNRPLSPHLQIYKPQITSILSILHRATGMALTLGSVFLVYWLYHIVQGESSYTEIHALMSSFIGRLFLVGWSFSLFYHLLNGIRHLLWDIGMGFEIKEVYATGYIVLFLSVSLTVIFWGVLCL